MTIEEIMTPGPNTLDKSATVDQGAEVMQQNRNGLFQHPAEGEKEFIDDRENETI